MIWSYYQHKIFIPSPNTNPQLFVQERIIEDWEFNNIITKDTSLSNNKVTKFKTVLGHTDPIQKPEYLRIENNTMTQPEFIGFLKNIASMQLSTHKTFTIWNMSQQNSIGFNKK